MEILTRQEEGRESELKPLSSLFGDSDLSRFRKPQKGKPRSERAELVQQIVDAFYTQDKFRTIMGQTSQMTYKEIYDLFDKAKRWPKNSPALFWKLVKEKREEIKKELLQAQTGSPHAIHKSTVGA